jgi:tetratricopeptide (TPR) repeat protein
MRPATPVQSEGTTRVFISATSKDLGTVRELIKEALLTMGCMPIEQTNFPPDYRSVREMIEEKVASCEAVIHIVGIRYGAEPDPSTLPQGAARRSYTQIEADIARKLGKKLYLFVCSEDFPYDQAPAESEEFQGLQQAYRAEIVKGEILWTKVNDREELACKVRELQFELERLKTKIGKNRRRVAVSLAVLLLLLGGIAVGIWRLPAVVKKEVGYDRGRAREQLVADIKEQAQKKIAEAGDDWRKTIEIEKWRDQQLADVDRLLDRIQQTFDAGETTESYRKATALLAAKGADEALAYLQARSNQRKAQIEMQANQRDQEEADLRNLLQEELLSASLLQTKFRFDDAESKYREVLEKSGSWSKARNDFAWFLIQRGGVIDPAAGNAKLQEALELCRGTLAFASRKTAPQDWALTQNNLGSVLNDLGERVGGEQGSQYLEQSMAAFQAALEVRTREQLPQDWATTQNNLGTVLRDLGLRVGGEQGSQYLYQSAAAFRSALEVRTREQLPQDWATTQNNLGTVLWDLEQRMGGKEGLQYLSQSVAAFRAALEVYTREQMPQQWAMTQNNLGIVLRDLGQRASGKEGSQWLEWSVVAFRGALEVYTHEQLPQQWAMTQNNLGIVLGDLGQRASGKEGSQYLEQSVAAFRAALEVYSREQIPQQWAMTQNNLGIMLSYLGQRASGEQGAQYLEQSMAAFRAALEVYTRAELPRQWAMTQNNLGQVLRDLGQRVSRKEGALYLQQSVEAIQNALSIFTPQAAPYQNSLARDNLEKTDAALHKISAH